MTSLRRTITTFTSAALLAVSLAACAPDEEDTPAESSDANPRLLFSFGQSVHPFFVAMQKGAEGAAEELGAELVVQSADFNIETQVRNVEDGLQQQIDAILINPIDSSALANTAQQALDQDVPVFTVDIDLVGAESTSFIASDNVEIGREAARYIIDELDGTGKIALIGWPTITSTADRERGFLEVIEEEPGIEIVAQSGDAMERSAALDAAETILQANPDLDAVFGVNESGAVGALGAVEARGLEDIFIIGVDATEELLQVIADDSAVTATVAQDPYQMGRLAVENAIKYLSGEDVEDEIPVQIDLVTTENVQEFIDREAAYLQ